MKVQDCTTRCASFAEQRRQNEAMWTDVIAAHYPGGQLVNISPHHRVIRHNGKAVKIQNGGVESAIVSDQSVGNEYEVLANLDGAAGPLNPVLKTLRTNWQALELDWIDGRLLVDILADPAAPAPSVRTFARRTYAIARRGIVYSQFRGRHVIVDKDENMTFIDFGGSRKSSSVRALLSAFAPLARRGRRWEVTPFWYLAKKILERKRKIPKTARTTPKRMAHWSFAEQAAEIEVDTNDEAIRHLCTAETEIKQAAAADPDVIQDIPTAFFGPFYMRGSEHWELLWHDITHAVSPQGRRVLVPNAGIGLAAIFAATDGAAHVRAKESNPLLLSAAKNLSQAFGGPAPLFSALPESKPLAHDDLVIQLSHRRTQEDQVSDLRTFAAASDIVLRTSLTDHEIDAVIDAGRRRRVLRANTRWRLIHFTSPQHQNSQQTP